MANWDDQGKQYAAFIDAQLKAEYDRRDSVNSRAGSALTGAAGLVTVVLAVFAVFLGKDPVLTGFAKISLGAAVILLLFAAAAAVMASYPWAINTAEPDSLRSLIEDNQWWGGTETSARNITSGMNLDTIKELRRGTSIKFFFLMAALALQVLAVLGLVACTLAVLDAAPKPVPPRNPNQSSMPVVPITQCPAVVCVIGNPPLQLQQIPVTNGRG